MRLLAAALVMLVVAAILAQQAADPVDRMVRSQLSQKPRSVSIPIEYRPIK